MKIIIDVPEDELLEDEIEDCIKAVENNFSDNYTTISDNTTNGEVLNIMFPHFTQGLYITDNKVFLPKSRMCFSVDWWNRPYGADMRGDT